MYGVLFKIHVGYIILTINGGSNAGTHFLFQISMTLILLPPVLSNLFLDSSLVMI